MIGGFGTRSLALSPAVLFLLSLTVGIGWTAQNVVTNQPIPDGNTTKMVLTGNKTVQRISFDSTSHITINVMNMSRDTSFLILQVHTYQYNVSLSYDNAQTDIRLNNSVFGSNIGLFFNVTPTDSVKTVYLRNDNVHVVDALLAVLQYGKEAPIPGGCNVEFNIETAPYQRVLFTGPTVIVDFQPASEPYALKEGTSCDKSSILLQTYHMYLSYQDFTYDSYLAAIEQMLTPEDIMTHGTKVPALDSISPMRRVYSAYYGVGSVYAVIAVYKSPSRNRSVAAYVPAFSYACSPVLYPETCQILSNTFSKVIASLSIILGIIFIRPRSKMVAKMLPIFLAGAIIGYIIVAAIDSNDTSTSLGVALGTGISLVIVWYYIISYTRLTLPLASSLVLGYYSACIAYYHFPVTTLLSNDWVFWVIFFTIGLGITLVTLLSGPIGTTLTCAICDGSLIVLAADYFQGSSLKYILINVIRRLTVSGFNVAIIDHPTQTADILFAILWAFLVALRLYKELLTNKQPKYVIF